MIEVQFIGSGDAFGSGGWLQTCLLVRGTYAPLLIDCGASSLIGMKRLGIDPVHPVLDDAVSALHVQLTSSVDAESTS